MNLAVDPPILIALTGVFVFLMGVFINLTKDTEMSHIPGILVMLLGFVMIFHHHIPFLKGLIY